MSNHVLIEVGVEELPARFIDDAEKQLQLKTEEWLGALRITFDDVKAYSTPRRLAIVIENIAAQQATKTEEVRGPQLKIAKDDAGNWTKAALGFLKSQGKEPEDVYSKSVKGTDYIFVEKVYEGQETAAILPEIQHIIEAIHFPQTMRWGNRSFRYARPIRWIVALYNDEIIPFEIAGVPSGNTSYGHRFLGKTTQITNPLQYEQLLGKQFVIVDSQKREELIMNGIQQLEEKEGFSIQVDKDLLQEVRNLVEYPTVFFGAFHENYLQLPNEALITSMKEHQRYFPIRDKEKATLLPYFVSVRNGDMLEIENVIKGNEKVLRARLADAAFFFEEDKKQSIDFYMNKLKTVIFQEKIGTIHEKVKHNTEIVKQLNEQLGIAQPTAKRALRAAAISKFDLMTNMVNEFTELQGIMGEKYALYFGEEKEVAQAIKEHYLPKQANGGLPSSLEGAIVSVADKLDTIVSCFSVDLIPTGSQDPYGLRRQAIGILRILLNRDWHINFEDVLSIASTIYKLDDEQQKAIQQFFLDRAAYILSESDMEQDVIQAVLANGIGMLSYTLEKAILLSEKRNEATFKTSQEALVRILNLDKHAENTDVKLALFQTDSERELYDTFINVEQAFNQAEKDFNPKAALQQLEVLTDPIHDFFEYNMVMAEDAAIRSNRLALVHIISKLIHTFAELSLVEWKQHKE